MTHFPAHSSLPQHAQSCASFLSRAAQRRPGPVSSLGIDEERVRVQVASTQQGHSRKRKKVEGHLRWHLSALMAYEMAGNEFEYVGKARQCVVFVLPVESVLKGVKRGAHPNNSTRTRPRRHSRPAHNRAPHLRRVRTRGYLSRPTYFASTNGANMTSSEVFNPNPTIIATAAPTARRRAAQAHSLWLSDDEDSDIYDSADDNPEPIDADEIFGLYLFLAFFFPLFSALKLSLVHFS